MTKKIIFLMILFTLSSCCYRSKNIVRIKGDDIHVPYMGIRTIKGEDVEVIIYRETDTCK